MRPTEDQQRAIVAQREREAIAVELAGLRRDAERYRWLRKGDLDSLRVIGLPQTEAVYDRELDAEMKAAGEADAYMRLYGESLLEIAGLKLEASAAVERAFCDAALAFADAKASIEDQAAEYKRTLAALQAARGTK